MKVAVVDWFTTGEVGDNASAVTSVIFPGPAAPTVKFTGVASWIQLVPSKYAGHAEYVPVVANEREPEYV